LGRPEPETIEQHINTHCDH